MNYFSTFSGVGGFEIGIQNAYADSGEDRKHEQMENVRFLSNTEGNEQGKQCAACVGFSEIDKYASAVLKYRFPNVHNYGDITKIDARVLPEFDLLVGGFPCQSFSVAGKRGGFEDARGTLFFEMARIAKEKKPKFWLAENVKGLFSHDDGKTLKVILATMQELGYSVSIEIINAKNYGVPQNRERVFIAGYHIPTVCKEVLSDIPPKKTDTFVKITKGFLFQLLLNGSAEVLKVQEGESKDLVLGSLVLNAIIKAGQKGNWIFSSEISKALYESFVNCSLVEMKERFTIRQGCLDEKLNILAGISTKAENKSLSAEEELWANIALLLSDESDEGWNEPNKFITSTLIKQTIEKTTFTYVEMLRTIVSFTLHLRSSSSPLWNEVLSDLIILKVGTNYEPITSQTPERIIGRSGFVRRDNLSDALRGNAIITVGSRTKPVREILFERGASEENPVASDPASIYKQTERLSDAFRIRETSDVSATLKGLGGGMGAKTGLYAIRQPLRFLERNQKNVEGDYAFTVDAGQTGGVKVADRIRRLTPLECERLMSWPDTWTAVGTDEKGSDFFVSDSQRYKMCGNGVVSKVVEEVVRAHLL